MKAHEERKWKTKKEKSEFLAEHAEKCRQLAQSRITAGQQAKERREKAAAEAKEQHQQMKAVEAVASIQKTSRELDLEAALIKVRLHVSLPPATVFTNTPTPSSLFRKTDLIEFIQLPGKVNSFFYFLGTVGTVVSKLTHSTTNDNWSYSVLVVYVCIHAYGK